MKKIFYVFVFCILAIVFTYFFRASKIDIGSVKEYVSDITQGETFTYTNDFKVNKLQMKNSDYYFNNLTDEQKKIYSYVAYSVSKFEERIKIKEYTVVDNDTSMKDVGSAIEAFFADHPEVFYLNFEYQVSTIKSVFDTNLQIQVSYNESSAIIESNINKLDSIINGMIKSASGLSPFDKQVALHDALGKMTVYYNYTDINEIPMYCHTIFGAFIEKKAVCDGFTKGMQILLDRVNIESVLVSGTNDGQPHAWNLVKQENKWYHMDLTSDKLIKETDGSSPNIVHSYFNITDSQIKETHVMDKKYVFPAANSDSYNYYKVTGYYIYGTDKFNSKLTSIVNKQINNGVIEFACDTFTNVPDKMIEVLYNMNYNGLGNKKGTIKVEYYNVLNSYIVPKK
ncbi:MAG: hypothetical protein N2749_05535 [Clostridia bacterium]|nr:hypothetical protein [Clostridia bacterium]